jgi:hypothetical protein
MKKLKKKLAEEEGSVKKKEADIAALREEIAA